MGKLSVQTKDENDGTPFSISIEMSVVTPYATTVFQIFPDPVPDVFNVQFSAADVTFRELIIYSPLGSGCVTMKYKTKNCCRFPSLFSMATN